MGATLSSPVDSIIVHRAGCSTIRCAVATMQGWRCSHEDSHVMIQASEPSVPFFFSVMDGHGGDEAALEMFRLLPRHVEIGTLPKLTSPEISQEIKDRFKAADVELRKILPPDCSAGATCTSALVVRSERNEQEWDAVFANAGDSRTLVIHSDGTFSATEDHKPDNSEELHRIETAGGFVSHDGFGPARVDSNLAVSRAFGDFEYKSIETKAEDQKISCVPDVTKITARDGDFILLCCDGIFDVMSNEDCVEFVLNHDISDLGRLVADLLKHVLDKGSKDNCSAMICQLGDIEKHKEDDELQSSTTLDKAKWHGFHDGYMTSMIIPGALSDADDSVKEKFASFHRVFGFDPLPQPCTNCGDIYLGMQICSRCRKTQYCSHYCQKKDWKTRHKEACKIRE